MFTTPLGGPLRFSGDLSHCRHSKVFQCCYLEHSFLSAGSSHYFVSTDGIQAYDRRNRHCFSDLSYARHSFVVACCGSGHSQSPWGLAQCQALNCIQIRGSRRILHHTKLHRRLVRSLLLLQTKWGWIFEFTGEYEASILR